MVPNFNGLSMAFKRGVSNHLQTETFLQAIAHHHHKGMPETKKHGKKPSISQVAVGYLVRRVFYDRGSLGDVMSLKKTLA